MDDRHLRLLGQNAKSWAKAYTALTEALIAEGVEESKAREEARAAANFATLLSDEEIEPEICPVCGVPGVELTTQGDEQRYFSCRNFHQWTAPLQKTQENPP